MDGLIFIHANAEFEEQGVLSAILSADMEVDQSVGAELIDNTWSITISADAWEQDPVRIGDYVYAPGTEWGGPVTTLQNSTSEGSITLQGPTWRGLLFQGRIEPPAGEAYLVLNNVDANEAIDTAIGDKFGGLFNVPSAASGISVSASWRYQTIAGGLHSALRAAGARLVLVFNNLTGKVDISATTVDDLTDEVEISQDYGVNFVSTDGNIQFANHCLALGSGQLTARIVLNVYAYNGQYYTTKPAGMTDAEIRTVLLDYPNTEDQQELLRVAIERLEEKAAVQSIRIDAELIGLNAELGDLIGVRDRLTGMTATSEVVRKILTITDGRIVVSTEVG